jgi:hypothetical protein
MADHVVTTQQCVVLCCAYHCYVHSAGTDAEHSLALHDWSAAAGGAAEGGLLASGKVLILIL